MIHRLDLNIQREVKGIVLNIEGALFEVSLNIFRQSEINLVR